MKFVDQYITFFNEYYNLVPKNSNYLDDIIKDIKVNIKKTNRYAGFRFLPSDNKSNYANNNGSNSYLYESLKKVKKLKNNSWIIKEPISCQIGKMIVKAVTNSPTKNITNTIENDQQEVNNNKLKLMDDFKEIFKENIKNNKDNKKLNNNTLKIHGIYKDPTKKNYDKNWINVESIYNLNNNKSEYSNWIVGREIPLHIKAIHEGKEVVIVLSVGRSFNKLFKCCNKLFESIAFLENPNGMVVEIDVLTSTLCKKILKKERSILVENSNLDNRKNIEEEIVVEGGITFNSKDIIEEGYGDCRKHQLALLILYIYIMLRGDVPNIKKKDLNFTYYLRELFVFGQSEIKNTEVVSYLTDMDLENLDMKWVISVPIKKLDVKIRRRLEIGMAGHQYLDILMSIRDAYSNDKLINHYAFLWDYFKAFITQNDFSWDLHPANNEPRHPEYRKNLSNKHLVYLILCLCPPGHFKKLLQKKLKKQLPYSVEYDSDGGTQLIDQIQYTTNFPQPLMLNQANKLMLDNKDILECSDEDYATWLAETYTKNKKVEEEFKKNKENFIEHVKMFTSSELATETEKEGMKKKLDRQLRRRYQENLLSAHEFKYNFRDIQKKISKEVLQMNIETIQLLNQFIGEFSWKVNMQKNNNN